MKFVLVNIPLRSEISRFPPIGCTALLDVMIKAGYDPKFYDINALRPSFQEVVEYFRKEQPDILGISAVVSTAYRYTKELSLAVKQVSPKTKIILGGCLAASAEILLRKCPIDVCVIGEGEKVLLNLLAYWERFHDFSCARKEFANIKGIAFIDAKGDFIFSGYEEQLLPQELPEVNYELLKKYSDIGRYIHDPLFYPVFERDKRFYEPQRKGQKSCVVMTGKGCISRCTFCHRWLKGYRSYTVENIIMAMKHLKEKYNVGFFTTGDENFGAIPGMLDRFIEAVRPLDILFRIPGIRISSLYQDLGVLRRLKEVGCVQILPGVESCSDKILTIMEKGVSGRQNMEVARELVREGMILSHQLVIGMPGESDRTIKESIARLKYVCEDMKDYPYNCLSINYFQALPGTPGYEFLRMRGIIGGTLDDEEAYLLRISNCDAASPSHYQNVSEECRSKALLWPYRIRAGVTAHWYKRRGWRKFSFARIDTPEAVNNSYRNRFIQWWYSLRTTRLYFFTASLLGDFFWFFMIFFMRIRIYGLKKAFLFSLGLRQEADRKPFIIRKPESLRKIVVYPDPKGLSVSEANMLILRKGR